MAIRGCRPGRLNVIEMSQRAYQGTGAPELTVFVTTRVYHNRQGDVVGASTRLTLALLLTGAVSSNHNRSQGWSTPH
jgi:hypothetical protein